MIILIDHLLRLIIVMRLIVNIKLPKTKTSKKKKKVHFNSCHPDFTIDVLP